MPFYYEDFTIGQTLESRSQYTISRENAIAFAQEYDPQAQHLDDEKAKDSIFGALVVSGWHTAAVTMRLKTQTDLADIEGGLVGLGTESMRWPRPTMPGDTLRLVITILDKRLSQSKPGKGIIRYKAETLNQKGELMMEMFTNVIVPCRT
ncbi:MAG: MaoC family dehydratase [Alphaproteobacteria bacterium]